MLKTADELLKELSEATSLQKVMNAKWWEDIAGNLNEALGPEHEALEKLRTEVAQKTLEILKTQEKRNVAAAELEVSATPLSQEMRLQEHKVARIERHITLAKMQARTAGGF